MTQNQFPQGWDNDRVKRLLTQYESQTEDEAISEDEAAYQSTTHTMMSIPIDLAPQVRSLIDGYLQR